MRPTGSRPPGTPAEEKYFRRHWPRCACSREHPRSLITDRLLIRVECGRRDNQTNPGLWHRMNPSKCRPLAMCQITVGLKTLGRNFDRMNVSRNRESMRCKSRRRYVDRAKRTSRFRMGCYCPTLQPPNRSRTIREDHMKMPARTSNHHRCRRHSCRDTCAGKATSKCLIEAQSLAFGYARPSVPAPQSLPSCLPQLRCEPGLSLQRPEPLRYSTLGIPRIKIGSVNEGGSGRRGHAGVGIGLSQLPEGCNGRRAGGKFRRRIPC
jgi:hypothetical protein